MTTEQNMGVHEDRISQLPDAVLLHILSFLPTKCVASTSILAKRWRYMWTSIPILDFRGWWSGIHFEEDHDTDFEEDDIDFEEVIHLETEIFMNSVDRILSHHEDMPNIQKFYFEAFFDIDESRVNAWITTVIKCKVEELHLYTHALKYVTLPPCVFTSESLTVLELVAVPLFCFHESLLISLPRLKILQLSHIIFGYGKLTQQLFSNCPVLEELMILDCSWPDKNVVTISAPELKHFEYSGSIEFLHLGNVSALTKAKIHLPDFNLDPVEVSDEMILLATKLLSKLPNVEYLDVYGTIFQVLSFGDDLLTILPTFNNLIGLEVPRFSDWGCRGLLNFLQISPNLESLAFDWDDYRSDLNNDDDWTIDVVPSCMVLHLKSVTFNGFCGEPCMLNVVKLFVTNASVLQEMTLVCSSTLSTDNRNKLEEAKKQLLMFPTRSEDCVIRFISSQ